MQKLILFIAATFCVVSAAEPEISNATKDFKIIPDDVSSKVPELLKITFDSGASVNMGNVISPSDAKNQPTVKWDADKNAYYTIVCYDPDSPLPGDSFLSEVITWVVGNIPGKDIDSGNILAEYIPVAPPGGKKFHRTIFLVFKQQRKFDFDEKPIDKYTIRGRANFLLKDFVKKYNLGEAIARNFYTTKFDSFIMEVYEMLNTKCAGQYIGPYK